VPDKPEANIALSLYPLSIKVLYFMMSFVNLCEYLSPTLPIPDRTGLSLEVSIAAVGKYDVTVPVSSSYWMVAAP